MTRRPVFSWLAPKLFSRPVRPRAQSERIPPVAKGGGGAAPSPTHLRMLLGEEHPAYAAATYVTMTGFLGDWRRDGASSYGLVFATFDGKLRRQKVSDRDFRRMAIDAAHRLHPVDYGQNGPFQGCRCEHCASARATSDAETTVTGAKDMNVRDEITTRASCDAGSRRERTARFIASTRCPPYCAQALVALDALIAAGRLSSIEADMVAKGIWPVRSVADPVYGPQLVPLLQVVAQPTPPCPPRDRS